MRKLIFYISSIIIILSVLNSCYPMDDNYGWLVKDGPIVYLNRADTAVALGGRNKIRLKWFKEWDSRAVQAKVFWNGNKDSVSIDLNQAKTEFVIDSLSETVYSFELYFFSADGLKSCATSVVGRSYGINYEAFLLNRLVKVMSPNNHESIDCVQLVLPDFKNEGYRFSEILYTDIHGVEKVVEVHNSQADTVKIIKSQISLPRVVKFRSVYVPEPEGFEDYFYSKWSVLDL